jgi:hypothetical protein
LGVNLTVSMLKLGLNDPSGILTLLRNTTGDGVVGSESPASSVVARAQLLERLAEADPLSAEQWMQGRELARKVVRSIKDAAKRGCLPQDGCVLHSPVDLVTALRVLGPSLDKDGVREAAEALSLMHAPGSPAEPIINRDGNRRVFVHESHYLLSNLIAASVSASSSPSNALYDAASSLARTATALLPCGVKNNENDYDSYLNLVLNRANVIMSIGRVPGSMSLNNINLYDPLITITMETPTGMIVSEGKCDSAGMYIYALNLIAYPTSFTFREYVLFPVHLCGETKAHCVRFADLIPSGLFCIQKKKNATKHKWCLPCRSTYTALSSSRVLALSVPDVPEPTRYVLTYGGNRGVGLNVYCALWNETTGSWEFSGITKWYNSSTYLGGWSYTALDEQ